MKCRYMGSGDSPPQETTFRGVHFKRGQWVYVNDPETAQKIQGSACFEVAEGHEIAEAEFTEVENPVTADSDKYRAESPDVEHESRPKPDKKHGKHKELSDGDKG